MSQVWEYIKIALMNIRSNKGRSVLTMLGIIIGISSVIMIISVGNGIKSEVNGELNDMAGGQVAIYTDMQQNQEEQVFFSEEDFDAIQEKVAHVKSVTPVYNVYGSTSTRKGSFDIMLSCGTAGLKDYSKDPIIKGHFFTENDYYGAKKVCVIPESTARTLFGTTDVVGMTLNLDIDGISQEFEVIGIRQDSSAALINMTSGGMQTMEIPLSTLETFGYYVSDFSDFYIIGESNEYTSKIAKDSVSLLEKRHNVRGKGIILVQSFNDALAQVNSVLNYITIFVVLVAAISLLVGGIGVMNRCRSTSLSVCRSPDCNCSICKNRFCTVAIFVRICNYYIVGRIDRNLAGRTGRIWRLRPDRLFCKGEAVYGVGRDAVFFSGWNFLRNLSCKKGCKIESD